MEENTLKKLILQKLIRGNIWGGKHKPLDFVHNGLPDHYRNTHQGKKMIERAVKNLLNDQWIILLPKRTGKSTEDHLSLNPQKVSEIRQFLERN